MSHSLSMRYVSLNKCLHTFQVKLRAISESKVTFFLIIFFTRLTFLPVFSFLSLFHALQLLQKYSYFSSWNPQERNSTSLQCNTHLVLVQSRTEPSDISGRNDMYFDHFDSTSEVLQTCVSNQQERYIETLNIRPWLAGRMWRPRCLWWSRGRLGHSTPIK